MANRNLRRIHIHLLVLGLYAILAAVTTWPVVRYLGTHVPGSYTWAFDGYTFLWNMWWFRHSLFTLGQNPLYSTHAFYPLGISLALYTYNLFNAIVSLPLQAFLSLPAASNLLFLFSTVFTGYGAFLLVAHLLRTTLGGRTESRHDEVPASRYVESRALYSAAFLAGLLYAFGSYRMVYAALGHYNLWSTTWIPFYTLYLVRAVREPQLRNAALAGLFLVLLLLCDMMLAVFVGVLTLILLAGAVLGRSRAADAGGAPGLGKRLVLLVLVTTVLYLPALLPVLGEIRGGYELAGWGDAEKLSVDLMGLFTPTALHPLGGDWVDTLRQTREGTSRFRDVNTVFLGWVGLALAVVGAIRYRRQVAIGLPAWSCWQRFPWDRCCRSTVVRCLTWMGWPSTFPCRLSSYTTSRLSKPTVSRIASAWF